MGYSIEKGSEGGLIELETMSKDLKLGRQRDSDGGLLEEERSLQREEPWQRLSGGSVPSRGCGRDNRGAVGDEGGGR